MQKSNKKINKSHLVKFLEKLQKKKDKEIYFQAFKLNSLHKTFYRGKLNKLIWLLFLINPKNKIYKQLKPIIQALFLAIKNLKN